MQIYLFVDIFVNNISQTLVLIVIFCDKCQVIIDKYVYI